MSLVDRELLTLPEHLSSPLVFSGVRVTRSLVLYVCFVDCCLSFCTFSFGHCVVCSSSTYAIWLPLWYLQTLLTVWYFFCFFIYNLCFHHQTWMFHSHVVNEPLTFGGKRTSHRSLYVITFRDKRTSHRSLYVIKRNQKISPTNEHQFFVSFYKHDLIFISPLQCIS